MALARLGTQACIPDLGTRIAAATKSSHVVSLAMLAGAAEQVDAIATLPWAMEHASDDQRRWALLDIASALPCPELCAATRRLMLSTSGFSASRVGATTDVGRNQSAALSATLA